MKLSTGRYVVTMLLLGTSVLISLAAMFSIYLSPGDNKPGQGIILEPNGVSDSADTFYEITWADGGDFQGQVSLFYDTDNQGLDGTLIVQDIPARQPENNYFWNTAGVPDGDYYIYLIYSDDLEGTYNYSQGPVAIAHNQACLRVNDQLNLLPNPGFEDADGLFPANWTPILPEENRQRTWEYEWVNDPQQAHSGNRAIKIANVFNGNIGDDAWQDRIIIDSSALDLDAKDNQYLLTGWIKTENVVAGQVIFRAKYYNKNGSPLSMQGHDSDSFYVGGADTGQWTQVAFLLNPPHWDSPPYPVIARPAQIAISFTLDNSPGTLWVDDLALVQISHEQYARYNPAYRYSPPPIMTASAPVTLPGKSGWSSTIQQDPATGVWWIVGEDQIAYWAVGAVRDADEKLLTKVGLAEEDYEQNAQYRARADLNFNQNWRKKLGPFEYSNTQNYIHRLNFSSQPDLTLLDAEPQNWVLKDKDGNLIADYDHYFADVFSPIWQEFAVIEAETLLTSDAWKLTDPQVLGYWTDNEWVYGDLHNYIWGDTAKLAFVDWLQGKNDLPTVDTAFAAAGSSINLDIPAGFELATPHLTPADLNSAWSSAYHQYTYTSFEDVPGPDKPVIRAHNDPVAADLYAFERVIYKIYVDTIIDNIRKVETDYINRTGQGFHHAIFSNRFDLESPAALRSLQRNMDIFSRFDAIAINWYPDFNQTVTYQPAAYMELVKQTFHDATNRPVFVSEFGVAAEDADDYTLLPHLIVARWRPKTLQYQYQRGWAYNNLISTWANLPWVIGANWYRWSNGYGFPAGSDVRNSGIVDDNDHYYVPLTDNMRSINKQINVIRRDGAFSLNDINWAKVELKVCSESSISPSTPSGGNPTATPMNSTTK